MVESIIKQLPKHAKAFYDKVYTVAAQKYNPNRANKIALSILSKQFIPNSNGFVAKFKSSPKYHSVNYVFTAESGSVSKSIDGLVFRDYVLSSVNRDSDGEAFSDFALKRMTEQINEEKVKGRLEQKHARWKELQEKGLTAQEIEEELQKEDTGIEAVSAKYENGKMIARIKFTEEAYARAKDVKGASIEARYPEGSFREGVYHQARLQGFVLTDTPANPDALAI